MWLKSKSGSRFMVDVEVGLLSDFGTRAEVEFRERGWGLSVSWSRSVPGLGFGTGGRGVKVGFRGWFRFQDGGRDWFSRPGLALGIGMRGLGIGVRFRYRGQVQGLESGFDMGVGVGFQYLSRGEIQHRGLGWVSVQGLGFNTRVSIGIQHQGRGQLLR